MGTMRLLGTPGVPVDGSPHLRCLSGVCTRGLCKKRGYVRGVNAASQNFHPFPWFEHPTLSRLRPLSLPPLAR